MRARLRRQKAANSEFEHQRDFITYLRAVYPRYEKCTRLSLNGIKLPGQIAGRVISAAKATGMVKDESDLFIAVPAHGYHGIFIEMKKPKAKATPEQIEYLQTMAKLGYQAAICHTAQEAIDAFEAYLSNSPFNFAVN